MTEQAKKIYDELRDPIDTDARSDLALRLYCEHEAIFERALDQWQTEYGGKSSSQDEAEQRAIDAIQATLRKETKALTDILASGDFQWGQRARLK